MNWFKSTDIRPLVVALGGALILSRMTDVYFPVTVRGSAFLIIWLVMPFLVTCTANRFPFVWGVVPCVIAEAYRVVYYPTEGFVLTRDPFLFLSMLICWIASSGIGLVIRQRIPTRILNAALVALVHVAAVNAVVFVNRTHARADATVLHLWDRKMPSVWRVKAALDNGADVNASAQYPATELMEAITYRNPDCVKFLVSKGADVNVRADNHTDKSVLAWAEGHPDTIAILNAAGAK